ncbi:MAG: extracellular solute-binding protein, partial [Rhodobacteraceae bacterium]|nr:extracellular solute-binding protein [Paracoccaceae bacterium]
MKIITKFLVLAGFAVSLVGSSIYADTIRFWTTEEQPARLARQQDMAAQFEAASGISVEVIPVTETDLGTRATAAFAAGDLPDVIYHPLQYALP